MSLCLNYLHANAYAFYRPEAFAFMFVCAIAMLLLFLILDLLKGEWIFYVLLVILLLDFSVGAVHFLYLVIKKVVPFRSISFVYGGVIAISLLGGYVLKQKIRILSLTFFATIFITTIPFLPFRDNRMYTVEMNRNQSGNTNKPNILFLILDEHIGIDGIPTDVRGGPELKKDLLDLYGRNGYFVFSQAYSNYNRTDASLSNIFNQKIFTKRSEVPRMKQNQILEKLRQEGYAINGYQSDYLRFCGAGYQPCRKSFTYMQNSVGYLLDVDTTPKQRFLALFDGLIFSYKSVAAKVWRTKIAARPSYSASVAVDRILNEVTNDLKGQPRGNVFLIHLLMPHYPYIFDSSCNFKPEYARNFVPGLSLAEKKYEVYFEHARCLHKKLQLFLKALSQENGTTVIIMGDHGSRIRSISPDPESAKPVDYLDHFSTFLAIHPGDYNPEFHVMSEKQGLKIPVVKALRTYFRMGPASFPEQQFDKVYFRSADRFIPKDMVDFPFQEE